MAKKSKRLNVRMSVKDHTALKILAARAGMDMSEWVTRMIRREAHKEKVPHNES